MNGIDTATLSDDKETVTFTAGHGLEAELPVAEVLAAVDEDNSITVTDSAGLYADFEIPEIVAELRG